MLQLQALEFTVGGTIYSSLPTYNVACVFCDTRLQFLSLQASVTVNVSSDTLYKMTLLLWGCNRGSRSNGRMNANS